MAHGSDGDGSPTAAGPSADGAGRTILIVEDNAGVRQIVCDTLADEGWPVQAAQDGQQALDLAEQQRPALVVLDLAVPVRDGFAVAAQLRSAYGDSLPILVISGDGYTAEKAERVGAYAYLRKPFDLSDLVEVVRRGLGGG